MDFHWQHFTGSVAGAGRDIQMASPTQSHQEKDWEIYIILKETFLSDFDPLESVKNQ